jgi:rfaE bifunctional protein kinase chain/domain
LKKTDLVSAKQLLGLLRSFSARHLLVVGDLMLDRFVMGDVERISPEAPVPVVTIRSEDLRLGGAANVIHNIRGLGGKVTVCSVVGQDRAGQWLSRKLRAVGASTSGIFSDPRVRTVEKIRVIASPRHQQLVRLDHENHKAVPKLVLDKMCRFLERVVPECDAVVVSDYGKGTIVAPVLESLCELTDRHRRLTIVDPKKENFDAYRRATLVTPNKAEASEAAGIEISDRASLMRAGKKLLGKWEAQAVLITQGQEGMSLFRRDGGTGHFPTAAREVFDVTGAGDTVVATCALALAAHGSYEEAAILGNLAAGYVVSEVGTVAIQMDRLKQAIRERYAH